MLAGQCVDGGGSGCLAFVGLIQLLRQHNNNNNNVYQ